ncbi:GNAT family N-acetyltransferase [Cupriavidus sp. CV2]|uniref:GNAT family N-acetyltransferase n=1 Tax=Cupriavidus ulmosensis TaxID=3065913 RepID=UPI00296B0A90|nr:GNAT family N-acetyltransferase [Cupriavidus sp. CV2]MDW3687203.1 GNAT family N-acetyltransferase [Cupriavidus sp. CV2]
MRPRHATTTDLPDVEALLRSCSLPAGGIRRQTVQFHISRDREGLLGCAGIEEFGGNVALVRGLAVAKRARCAGLAGLLLSALVSDVRLRGIESLVVSTDTAAGYFSRLGFAPVELAALPLELRASAEFSATAGSSTRLLKVEL